MSSSSGARHSSALHSSYEIVRKLGQGAFGEVLLARVVETGELVALKRIFVRAAEQGLPDNVLREAKCMQAVQHPNVVRLRDAFARGSALVLVMEFCASDLGKLIAGAQRALPEPLVKCVLQSVLRGVAACHAAGLMHRDLKPSNVLVDAGGTVKIADFGLARPLTPWQPGQRPPQYTHTVATRWYRAPELLYGARAYTPAVDMWAVGCILAELLGLLPLVPGDNDIDQLSRTISLLGAIEPVWPGVKELPDWGKITFRGGSAGAQPLAQLLPDAPSGALALLSSLLHYDPAQRPTAQQALAHAWFFTPPLPAATAALREALMRGC